MADGSRAWIVVVVVIAVVALLAFMTVPVIGVLAAIAIPNFVAMQVKAKRAEVPSYVEGIRTAELAYDAACDEFVAAGDPVQAALVAGKAQRTWEGGPEWAKVGWSPDGPVRGAYWVEVTGETFTVHGICDVDGDGEFAEYTADADSPARLITPNHVY
jgi:hypothetical protein